MSDTGRKNVSDQLKEKVTPQDQKVCAPNLISNGNLLTFLQSYTQQASEAISGAYDRVAAAVVPNDQKSTTQQASDTIRGGSDDASAQGKGLYEQAKHGVNSLLGGDSSNTGRSNV